MRHLSMVDAGPGDAATLLFANPATLYGFPN
jgi:hypothetical protein